MRFIINILTLTLCISSNHLAQCIQPKVIIISLDGFRHDYLELAKAASVDISAFERIWRSGFRVMRIQNEFTTKTGPNHFSLATGMHEETHGFVENRFYDPVFKETFVISNAEQNKESKWFDMGAEPIWVTNILNGFQSATVNWPGSYAKIKGHLPTYGYRTYNHSATLEKRLNDIYDWISIEEVTLGLVYFHEPDASGHKYGPNSKQVLDAIANINDELNKFLDRIEANKALNARLNIIVTSDHGIAEMKAEQVIILSNYISEDMYDCVVSTYSVIWLIRPKKGYTALDIYSKLVGKHQHMHVYMKNAIPARYFYSKNRRIPEIVIYSDPGWTIARSEEAKEELAIFGDHGFDPIHPEMSPFFVAAGPMFPRKNYTVETIRIVDIYPMVGYMLGLKQIGPNNGSLERVRYLFRSNSVCVSPTWLFVIPVIVVIKFVMV